MPSSNIQRMPDNAYPFRASSILYLCFAANLEAMLQLQDKFKSVLDRMADLTDEKQQLEHLVLQLQCETETIGKKTHFPIRKLNARRDQVHSLMTDCSNQ